MKSRSLGGEERNGILCGALAEELCRAFNLVRSFRIGRSGLRVHQILSVFKIRARYDLVRPIRNERTRLKAPQSSAAKSSAEDTLAIIVRREMISQRE